MAESKNSFGAKKTLEVGGKSYDYFALDAVEGMEKLPYSLKVLGENLLRTEDGKNVTEDHIKAIANWDPSAEPSVEIQFTPARVLMQDFTGVPCVVDLATMREAVGTLGGNPDQVNPLNPAEMVIDHSVIIEAFGSENAIDKNVEIEYQRNEERYQFLRWGAENFSNFRVVPPGTGIVHQVNIEYLSRVVFDNEGLAYPDTCIGTDSHTTMENGLGILGWGVGGIEAEAAMLGQPVSMLIPEVVGFKITGALKEGVTATDLVLKVVKMLRDHKVVGKFVEFYGAGLDNMPLADRATIANMAPEYGATCGFFPVDDETLRYLRQTGRDEDRIALVEAYAKANGLWRDAAYEPVYTSTLSLDLGDVVPAISGPKRPQDHVALDAAAQTFKAYIEGLKPAPSVPKEQKFEMTEEGGAPSPSSDQIPGGNRGGAELFGAPVEGRDFTLNDGSVVIAAITSCTNTSNPYVLMAAGLVARKARALGLTRKPWVKTSLAPGSQVVAEYLDAAGLQDDLDALGFNLVGFGCTTCIGNSGPLEPEISKAIAENDLVAVSVLSGNRNFEGRISPDVRANYLASPPLVVAYAIAGDMNIDITREPIGQDKDGRDVFLKDIWPTSAEVSDLVHKVVTREMFQSKYADVFKGDERWQAVETTDSETYDWPATSTYIQNPPYFQGMNREPGVITDIEGARVLAVDGTGTASTQSLLTVIWQVRTSPSAASSSVRASSM